MKGFSRSLKYLTVFSLPVLTWVSLNSTGWLTFLPLLEAFVFIPVMELFLRSDIENLSEQDEKELKGAFIFDFWVYLASVLQVIILGIFLFSMQESGLSMIDYVGRVSAMGLMCGIYGINIAHELGHRPERYNHWASKLLLLTSLYMHFFIEHNRGHHRWVSTPHDPATSRKNEPVYSFWIRSIFGSYKSAWKLEHDRLKNKKLPVISFYNEMIQITIVEMALLATIYFFFGVSTVLLFIAAAAIGILLLETVNYIEHYGLLRKELGENKFEPVMPKHSWNSNHLLGRLFLFELSRHSDHHYKASRKYQILRHMENSPQMPTGYPGMILLSLLPPLWFHVMNRRLLHENANV